MTEHEIIYQFTFTESVTVTDEDVESLAAADETGRDQQALITDAGKELMYLAPAFDHLSAEQIEQAEVIQINTRE